MIYPVPGRRLRPGEERQDEESLTALPGVSGVQGTLRFGTSPRCWPARMGTSRHVHVADVRKDITQDAKTPRRASELRITIPKRPGG
jgi:hypothetical protein